MTKYRRPDDSRINLGSKTVNLKNGNPEFLSQEEGLLAKYNNGTEEFDDDEIFDEHIDFKQISKEVPISKI
jgi:hypothetical protein